MDDTMMMMANRGEGKTAGRKPHAPREQRPEDQCEEKALGDLLRLHMTDPVANNSSAVGTHLPRPIYRDSTIATIFTELARRLGVSWARDMQ